MVLSREVVMGFHGLVAAAVLISASCSAQPAPQPADPAPQAADQARAAKYPPSRDYRRERLDLIIAAAGGRGSNTDNGWSLFVSTVSAVSGVSRYALEASPVWDRLEKERPGESHSGDELLYAAAGRMPNLPPFIAEEGERIIDQFLRTSLPQSLDLIADERRVFPPIDAAEPAISILLPQLGAARSTARLDGGRMLLAAKRGDEKELLRAARANYGISRACAAEAVAISHLVATAIDGLTMARVVEINLGAPLSPVLCRRLLELDAAFPGPSFALSMRGEGLFCMDTIHWVYTKGSVSDLEGGGRSVLDKVKQAGQRALWVTREAALEQADQYFTAAAGLFDPDPSVRADAQEKVAAVQKRLESDAVFRAAYQPFATLAPALAAMQRGERQRLCLRGGYRMILAAELYRHDHGDYPDAADALKATLGDLPRDWFAKDDAPLRYKKIDPASDRLHRPYLIYSVGIDATDNSGAEDPKNQFRGAQSRNSDGFDLIINWDAEPEPAAGAGKAPPPAFLAAPAAR